MRLASVQISWKEAALIPIGERKRQQKERWQRDKERKKEKSRDHPIRERVSKEILHLIVAAVVVAVAVAIVKLTEERGSRRENQSLNHKRNLGGMRGDPMIEILTGVDTEMNQALAEKDMIELKLRRRKMSLHLGFNGRQIKGQDILRSRKNQILLQEGIMRLDERIWKDRTFENEEMKVQ